LKIKNYIRNEPYTINLENDYTILELASLILTTNSDSVIIVDNNKPVYIITSSDIINFFINSLQTLYINEVMEKFPKDLITIEEESDVYEAHKLMREHKIEHIIVLNENKELIGEVFYNDLIMKFVEFSLQDELTGLNNRRFLETILTRYSKSKTSIGFIFIDVDDFKFINDNYGHEKGDYVLSEIGNIIRSSIRDVDFGFRYGGDEFLVLVFGISKEILERISKRIFQKISSIKVSDINAKTSIGVSLYPEEADNLNSALKLADERLYKIKHSGKGKICHG
jgi:diguanylate cyclase (GGDEF)-like protein